MAITLDRALRQKEVLKITGWSRSTLRRRVSEGKFPPPQMSSKRMPTWFESVVAAYQRQVRAAAGLPEPTENTGSGDTP
jgi:predicted DNA-binding transcriptional regulator AlpA